MTVLKLVALGIALMIIVSGAYVFLIGFLRKKDVLWLIESELRKTPFGKYYQHIADADFWLREHKSFGISIESNDGLQLNGLWIPAEHPKGTILLVHGYRSNFLVDFGPALSYYHEMGLNMLIPEQRAHGSSEGSMITFGVKESMDMCSWLVYHNRAFGDYPVILSGLSMGASTVIYMLQRDLSQNVKGVIADCGFTSPAAILSAVFRRVTHLPAQPVLIITDLLSRIFAGVSIWELDAREVLRNSKLPILMIHGTDDDFVPCKMTEQAFAACASPKQLLLVSGAQHGESFLVKPDAYIETVKTFIERILTC